MGRQFKDYEKNRCNKIARHKQRRKNKKYNPYKKLENNNRKKLSLTKTQKTLLQNNFYKKPAIKDSKEYHLIIPKVFSMTDNPDETLKKLMEINYIFEKSIVKSVFLDYSSCEKLGLDASVITDLIVLNGIKYKSYCGIKMKLRGNYPKTTEAVQLFLNSGLLKHLQISNHESPEVVRLDPFTNPQNTNLLTNITLEYYNKCLQEYGFELNDEGLSHFGKLIGEIIDNLVEHSGNNGDWFVSGHFLKNQNILFGKGELTFISFGNTIYNNLNSHNIDPNIKRKLQTYKSHHFSKFSDTWTEETLWNVISLQYGISSKKDAVNLDRGVGTVTAIESFMELGNTIHGEIPKMLILSGKSHIIIDGTYKLKKEIINNREVNILAFNQENDLRIKPDKKFVKKMNYNFPGTIISVNFFVDRKYLLSYKGDECYD